MKEKPRFLITRLSAVGDCVLTMPVACAIRRAYPDAFIAWVVQGGGYQLLKDHTCLDEVIKVPKGWLKSPSVVWNLHRQLRDLSFDWCIDPQSLTKSSMAGWLSGADHRVSFSAPQGRELAPWLSTQAVMRTESHVVESYLQLLRPAGIECPDIEFNVPISAQAYEARQQFIDDNRLSNYYVINPGAGWDSKIWPAKSYGQVARMLGQSLGARSVVVWSGDREKEWAEQICAIAGRSAVMAPDTSLQELAAMVEGADFFLGSDTGPLHLAAAVGTRCVGLYGPTLPEDCGPFGEGHITLQAYFQSGTCRERRQAENLAMRAIGVQEVVSACQQMLGHADQCRAA